MRKAINLRDERRSSMSSMALHSSLKMRFVPLQQPGVSVVVITQSTSAMPPLAYSRRITEAEALLKRVPLWLMKRVQPGSDVVIVLVCHTIEQSMCSFIGSNVQRVRYLRHTPCMIGCRKRSSESASEAS